MKSRLNFEKTASSALIFATLSCWAANFSPAQAAPDISKAASTVRLESSTEKFPVSTNLLIESAEKFPVSTLPTKTEEAEVAPTTTQPTEAALANPTSKPVVPDSKADTAVETTKISANELAVAAPTNSLSLSLPEIPQANLQGVTGSTKALDETKVEDLTKPEHLEAQALPTEVEVNEPVPDEASSLELSEPTEVDDPMSQVTNVSQLSDVQPSDWAYEALRSLVERYGCLVGYPDSTFRGNRALTRYEFAAGLNACLNQVERLIATSTEGFVRREDLESLQRLVQEFQSELQALRGRVDNLEGRVAFLEENQFSTTTKLFGQVIIGAQGRTENDFDFFLDRFSDQSTEINLINNVQLSLLTQFSPRSILLTGLQAGNGSSSGTFLDTYVGLAYEGDTNNSFQLSDLNFRHLFGSNFAFIVGPVGVNPVNVFRGTNRVESAGFGPLSRFAQRNPIINIGGGGFPGSSGGAGVGFDWQIATPVSLQGVYSVNGASDPEFGGFFGGEQGTTSAGVQLVVSPTNNIDFSVQYLNSYSPAGVLGTGVGDDRIVLQTISPEGFLRGPIQTNAFGASVEWRATSRITVGGWGGYTTSDLKGGSGSVETVNWMAFLNFPDLLGEGNLGGIYFGQPPRITSSDISSDGGGRNVPSFVNRADILAGDGGQPDTTYHLEAFYRIRVTDNISVTPGVIYILNPNHNENNDNITIGAIRTTFTF